MDNSKALLKGKTIQFSMSQSPDLLRLGYGAEHMRDVVVQLFYYLISNGARVAYGGDWRRSGFTEFLVHEVEKAQLFDSPPPLINFLASPVRQNMDEKELGLLRQVANKKRILELVIINLDGTRSVDDSLEVLDENIATTAPEWATGLSAMRKEIENECDAHFFLGGKIEILDGKFPGLVEEAVNALVANKPVFISGAFGGASLEILKIFENCSFDELSELRADVPNAHFQMALDAFRARAGLGLAETFNNGLDEDENQILATTHRINDIVSLVLLGLTRLYNE